jgi:putative ABC transport system ATP-binding protein
LRLGRRQVVRADAGPSGSQPVGVGGGDPGGDGPSGSGTSTLRDCLAGILIPEAREIRFGGRRVDRMGEAERSALRRERFGFVFQSG